MRTFFYPALLCIFLFSSFIVCAQQNNPSVYWHNKERSIRYHPDGTDFVIYNGNRRFTRALYGTNTAFRVEAGDLPEFALYITGMGGNLKFGLINGDSSKWLIHATSITARYRPGCMIYDIEDRTLGKGKLQVEVLAMDSAEGIIVKARFENAPSNLQLLWVFGGASGKKFSRDGDMGPDPETSFYLQPAYCTDSRYAINGNHFTLNYGSGLVTEWDPYVNKNFATDTVKSVQTGKEQKLGGIVPPASEIHIADALQQYSPAVLYKSGKSNAPLITGKLTVKNGETYFIAIQKPGSNKTTDYKDLAKIFNDAEAARRKIANRIKIVTPDPYINTLGGVLGTAADAIWESPSYLHGSIGWRMRLNGWRGPYVADVLGWHDRAKSHFKAYSLSQVTTPLTGPVVMDTALHLARSLEKMGTSIFSNGYISRNPGGDLRPHHYDMNLVYIDAIIRHFYWTGDLAFAKEMWPFITRHLAWEKRNFDPDGDGLYDAYAAIWASDALQYSGGAVTHSSAYNYKANKEAAVIAKMIGKDAKPYEAEAVKILKAINTTLWMPETGSYAEYKDLLGNRLLHPAAALWTIYHSIDSEVPDPFQACQAVKYIDDHIPHIPVRAEGLEDGYETLSTTNWMPYDWSLNNVATAEVMHTALANWQAGRNEDAFNLYKSELLSTMYLGGSPGNIGQISFYDAARGEAYRDFADPVAMTARSTVEGLFGIRPNALKNQLLIKPGFPAAWNHASIHTPDISIDFTRKGKEDKYEIIPAFEKKLNLKLRVKAYGSAVESITLNGKPVAWKNVDEAIGCPEIEIDAAPQKKYSVNIAWREITEVYEGEKEIYTIGSRVDVQFKYASVVRVYDPQHVLQQVKQNSKHLSAIVHSGVGNHIAFVQVKQNGFTWWLMLDINVKDSVEMISNLLQPLNSLQLEFVNNSDSAIKGHLIVNHADNFPGINFEMLPHSTSGPINVPAANTIAGSNIIEGYLGERKNSKIFSHEIINWNVNQPAQNLEIVDLSNFFNDKLINIFKNQYLSPRPKTATLQLPTQGIGDWTHPLKTADIDDKGLRRLAGQKNQFTIPQGIIFATPSDTMKPNIIFTSQWDNYPKQVSVPLTGKAAHVYLLMAGTTNPMQSRLVNGNLLVFYTDGTVDTLALKNPESWWPIEQDYMDDGYAFQINAARPVRVHLKTGRIISDLEGSTSAYNGKMIDGGTATVLDMPLDRNKTLKTLQLQTIANDVVMGLMSITLQRE